MPPDNAEKPVRPMRILVSKGPACSDAAVGSEGQRKKVIPRQSVRKTIIDPMFGRNIGIANNTNIKA
jgi:hypothetical protein